jgi:hypothetical protein
MLRLRDDVKRLGGTAGTAIHLFLDLDKESAREERRAKPSERASREVKLSCEIASRKRPVEKDFEGD